jgi:hypothetical protein
MCFRNCDASSWRAAWPFISRAAARAFGGKGFTRAAIRADKTRIAVVSPQHRSTNTPAQNLRRLALGCRTALRRPFSPAYCCARTKQLPQNRTQTAASDPPPTTGGDVISIGPCGLLYRGAWTCGCCGREAQSSVADYTPLQASLRAAQSLARHEASCAMSGRDSGVYGRVAASLAAARAHSDASRDQAVDSAQATRPGYFAAAPAPVLLHASGIADSHVAVNG